MWVLVQEPKEGGRITGMESGAGSWALPVGEQVSIGSGEQADIQGVWKDTSMSRQHANLTVTAPTSSSTPAAARPEVVLVDVGSKFGTHLNSGVLSESQRLAETASGRISKAIDKPVKLRDNDRIRFGVMFSVFRLKWVDFHVTSSMLRSKAPVEGWLGGLGAGRLEAQWTPSTTHLAMSAIALSLKVVNCLAAGVPIVTPE